LIELFVHKQMRSQSWAADIEEKPGAKRNTRAGRKHAKEGWGGRRDSNPQQPESQSGDLPLIYDHHPKSAAKLVSSAGCVKPGSRPFLAAAHLASTTAIHKRWWSWLPSPLNGERIP
jgi:hypothetical protein